MIELREESCFQCARMVPLRRAPFLNPHLVYLVVIVKLPYECIVPGPILLGMHLPLIPFGPCTNHARTMHETVQEYRLGFPDPDLHL